VRRIRPPLGDGVACAPSLSVSLNRCIAPGRALDPAAKRLSLSGQARSRPQRHIRRRSLSWTNTRKHSHPPRSTSRWSAGCSPNCSGLIGKGAASREGRAHAARVAKLQTTKPPAGSDQRHFDSRGELVLLGRPRRCAHQCIDAREGGLMIGLRPDLLVPAAALSAATWLWQRHRRCPYDCAMRPFPDCLLDRQPERRRP
jgi:hypothetical protein